MDDLNTFDKVSKKENLTTLTTPFEQPKEDFGILLLGTLGIVGTLIAFRSCNKCN